MPTKSLYRQRKKLNVDGCETTVFSDGSIITKTTRKDLLCFDFPDILTLFQQAKVLRDIKSTCTNIEEVT